MELLIVSGPLGAGKTTTVNTLLRQGLDEGHRVALLINEFGESSIDGSLLMPFRAELQGIENLVNGCVCCSLRSDVVKSIENFANQPLTLRPTRLVLETTGLADPVDLVDLENEAALKGRVRLAGILTVLSCLTPLDDLLLDPVLHHQILLSSSLYLTKGDLDPEAEGKWLDRLAADYPIVQVSLSRQGLPSPEGPDPWRGEITPRTEREKPREAPSFGSARSLTLKFDHPIDPEALSDLFRAPLPGGQLLRAKGLCVFAGWPKRRDGSDLWSFQVADWRFSLAPFPALDQGEQVPTECVIIGRDLNFTDWRRALRALERAPVGARKKAVLVSRSNARPLRSK